ncbi:energy-coupling factor transporter ATPase [Bifidobacterium gallicum]|uniref:Cobalt ABC transporter, ATP-binding protein n=1 Tax=Bifidobacterium gallicum DSM 20093 = LMG 11596 TaxID=561180 RepID=D1NU22_9BIFI|nr:energy-coupling factor transporter ATPase [Bifidobacterium gallicum]EFA23226.1 cobalt ABC transporter, ATP-binding protein [Bifidobacterium gallicum DSM 20093 = LMG 11596]KFI58887.1 putative ABC transporter ATP-binding protein [Bifidobacterium gallicum DSM 20093 = LMG 11596]
MSEPDPLIALNHVRFSYDHGTSWALDDVSLTIRPGERVCLVGPNGSGKSTLSRLIAGLAAPDHGTITLAGHLVFSDETGVDPGAYRAARRVIGAVFQNPEDQLVTTVVEDEIAFGPENLAVPREQIGQRIDTALSLVRMQASRGDDPTVMSGGQQQRIAIADMLAMQPAALVLDEPTAMLDPDARADVMATLDRLQQQGTTLIIITHLREELARADRIVRLEHGRLVDDTDIAICATAPVAVDQSHATTAHTTSSTVAHGEVAAAMKSERKSTKNHSPIISCHNVSLTYPGANRPAVNGLDVDIEPGTVTAVLGENGSGKTTFARLLCALEQPSTGSITIAGIPVATARAKGRSKLAKPAHLRELRRTLGYVMQHPERQLFAPTVREDVAFGPRNLGLDDPRVHAQVMHALDLLNIGQLAERSPFELSDGQQRLVAIAGVLACEPSVIVMDEPTAGLDETATARMIDIIHMLRERGLTIVIVTHNVHVAEHIADRVIVFGQPERRLRDSLQTLRDGQGRQLAVNVVNQQHHVHSQAGDAEALNSPRRSWVAMLDPRVKMIGLLVLMCTAFTMSNWAQLGIGMAVAAGLVVAANIGIARLWRAIRWFVVMFIFVAVLNVLIVRDGTVLVQWGVLQVTDVGAKTGVLYALRFTVVIVLGAVMLETTTPTAMTDACESLMRPLQNWGWHVQEVALVAALALRFLPTLSREVQSVRDAQRCRAGAVESGSITARLRAMTAIIMPVFAAALRHADTLSLALDARCFEEGLQRTHWRVMRCTWRDWLLLAIVAVACAGLWLLRTMPL